MKLNKNDLPKFKNSKDFEAIREILIRLKNWTNEFPNFEEYESYLKAFRHFRLYMETEYICDTHFDYKETDQIGLIIKEAIEKLLYCFEDRYKDINEIDMTNNCIFISKTIKEICDKWHLNSRIIELYPGYDPDARLFGMQGFHYANLLYLNNSIYLIDLSYKQFFKKNSSFLEEIGVIGLCAPLPGIFMLLNEERRKLAEELLKNGFIELKDNKFKLYCDGFTISYRNGLYYENYQDQYSTSYTDEDYKNFLIHKTDSQINHEPIRYLGPLKPPH